MQFKTHWFPLLFLVLFSSGFASGSQLEVGSGQAFTTIQACLNAAQPGDICNVHAGSYTEQLSFPRSGTSTSIITLQANPGDTVNVSSTASPVVNINSQSFLTINGINFTYNGSGSGPYVLQQLNTGAVNGLTISNNTFTVASAGGGGGAALYVARSDSSVIRGNTFAVTEGTSACDGVNLYFSSNLQFTGNTIFGNADGTTGKLEDGMVVSGSNLNIANNVLHDGWSFDTHPDGIVIQGDGDRNGNHTANVTVVGNTVYNFTQGVYFDAIHNPLDGTNIIANNVIYETSNFQYPTGTFNKMNGIVIDGENISGSGFAVNAHVYNNTVDAHQLHLYVLRTGAGTVVDVKNNVFLNPPFAAVIISVTTGVTLDFNYYSQGNSTPIKWGSTTFSPASFKSGGLGETNGRTGNAGLTSTYTETATSDSVDHGTDLSAFFTTDKVGTSRPQGPAWDMGAYEFPVSGTPNRPAAPSNLTNVVH